MQRIVFLSSGAVIDGADEQPDVLAGRPLPSRTSTPNRPRSRWPKFMDGEFLDALFALMAKADFS
ncbi:hypothetical protein [Actinomadura roseirufa]|uniref:hypothetical protein n=1 Tax=Actinomadura roseirufa TaxID=2094049 RepID=UPI0013F14E25|nr:hypothetical protein [Actinomadura roseirufa]